MGQRQSRASHRLNQARQLISSVRVTLTVENRHISTVGYVRDPDVGQYQGYRAIVRVRSDRDVATEVILAEIERVQTILERAQNVAVGLELEDEFRATLEATLNLRTRVSAWKGKGDGDGPGPQQLHA